MVGQKTFKWDLTRKGSNITLLSGQYTALKNPDNTYETVLADINFESGSHYWEIKIDHFIDVEDIFIGITKRDINYYCKATEIGCFWGWMCTGDQKVESTSNGSNMSHFGGMVTIGDKVGVCLEYK